MDAYSCGIAGIELPDIRFWNDHVFGEGAVSVDADDLHELADVGFAGAALEALAASHVHLGGNKIAFLDAGHFVAEGHDFAAELVPRDQRRMNAVLRPAVPLINVEIGATDGGHLNLDQDIGASEGRNFDFTNFRTGRSLRLHNGEHGLGHDGPL